MTYVTGTRYYDVTAYSSAKSARKTVPQNVFGAAALACIMFACGWTVYSHLGSDNNVELITASLPPTTSKLLAAPSDRIAGAYAALEATLMDRAVQARAAAQTRAASQARETSARTALLYGPRLLGPQPGTFQLAEAPASAAQAAPDALPLPPARQVAEIVPVPMPRPAELRLLHNPTPARREMAQADAAVALPPKPPAKPSLFERLFGKPALGGTQLAFAGSDGGVDSDGQSLTLGRSPLYDHSTAVYDISAHTVYLPDGTKLEAHSGLGSMLDDPRYADRRMRGVTPPHTYDLSLRESLFHGVEAIRLKPVGGEDQIYGRSGLLAHTYMLGPNGDSNGCVSFRNYTAFLHAYKSGEIKRLVAVAKL
jgi:hypothetical protein